MQEYVGNLATLNQILAKPFTTLGASVYRADGTTVLTDAAAVTSLGTAAAITGQGTLATLNTVTGNLLASPPSGQTINADPTIADTTLWTTNGATRVTDSSFAGGRAWSASTSSLISVLSEKQPIDINRTYRVSIDAKSIGSSDRLLYTAVKFYDESGAAIGSGGTGWTIGDFHYFGLVGGTPPTSVTTYSVIFGPGQTYTAPATARFIALGGYITNLGSTGTHRMGNIRLEHVFDFASYIGGSTKPENNATVGAIYGNNLLESSGGATATLANFKTSLGTAAAIASQGALATLNSVDLATTQVVNKSLANVDSTANTKLSGIETGADVTSFVVGPTSSVFKYDYTGVAEAGQFTRNLTYTLNNAAGAITSGVTMTYTVLTGTVNSFTSASGAKTMTVSSGVGTFAIASLGSSIATVKITATYNSVSRTTTVTLTKDIAAAPTGGGGGAGTTIVSKTSNYTAISSTTFTDITGTMTGSTPSGITAATLSATLSFSPAVTSGSGVTTTVEVKFQRNISGTWTDKGSVQSATSNTAFDEIMWTADFNWSVNDTGLTASTSYQWRVVARVTSGTRQHSATGNVTVTAA
jgi:hypothetical protein